MRKCKLKIEKITDVCMTEGMHYTPSGSIDVFSTTNGKIHGYIFKRCNLQTSTEISMYSYKDAVADVKIHGDFFVCLVSKSIIYFRCENSDIEKHELSIYF